MYGSTPTQDAGYRHAAAFHAGRKGCLRQLLPFVLAGVVRGEPILVVVPAPGIDTLRRALGEAAAAVEFADMGGVGANPACIIPAWQDFVDAHPGRHMRGVGEPIFPGRSPDELTEYQHHERLLNRALAGSQLFLVCPYDVEALPRRVIEEARRSHPFVYACGRVQRASAFKPQAAARGLSEAALPEPESEPDEFKFTAASLGALRAFARSKLAGAGLAGDRALGFLTALGEVAANCVSHGGGGGTLRIWRTADSRLVCDVVGAGRIDDPLVDRRRPAPDQVGGRGLWLANHLCDLVQLRSLPTGVVARLHMRIG
jgi:hypothetical protein